MLFTPSVQVEKNLGRKKDGCGYCMTGSVNGNEIV